MRTGSLLLVTLAILALFFFSTYVEAAPAVIPAPPEPIYEVDDTERAGYVRKPGYWRWNGKSHVWRPARWVPARKGQVWVADGWEQRDGTWTFAPGYWKPAEMDRYAVDDEPENITPPKSDKKYVKRVKEEIDYQDTTKWPRVIRR